MNASQLARKLRDYHRRPLPDDAEPRWIVVVAVLAVLGLHLALPGLLTPGPAWAIPLLVAMLLVPTAISHRRGHHHLNHFLGMTAAGVLTFDMLWSVAQLLRQLPHHNNPAMTPTMLLHSAAILWLTNVLIFALWYWHLDAGGPNIRALRAGHPDGSFLFPQMTMDETTCQEAGIADWSPGFVDYLFLAFNASTALSPADTAVLSRWAKLLMMLQALLSLTIVAFLAARAVNIL